MSTDRAGGSRSIAVEGPRLVSLAERDAVPARPGPIAFEDRYERLAILGAGGMGEVRLCHDRVIGRDVAMKVIHAPTPGSPRRWRFVREARVQGQLEHPAIVPVYDLGIDPDGFPYFTMKHVRGVSLAEVIASLRSGDADTARRFGPRRMLSLFERVCLAVEYIHRRGVLHRDLKPSNVMLGELGEVYLLDWGLAKILDAIEEDGPTSIVDASNASSTGEGAVLGTPGYMSPEQLRGESERLGPWSDVYGLGAILFELLALTPLHGTEAVQFKLLSTLRTDGARPSEHAPRRSVPPALDALCHAATRLAPAERVGSAAALAEAVQAHLDR